MFETKDDRVYNWLTPSEEEQALRILKGECPHNKGWEYAGHNAGHGHTDSAYRCKLCKELEWY